MDKRANKILLTGAICLALVFVIAYLLLYLPGIGTRWKRLADPPEQIALLKQEDSRAILAQTSGGDLYQFEEGQIPSWKKVADPAEISELPFGCSPGGDSRGYIILPPPGGVRSGVSIHCVGSETAFHLRLVLLENGQIWSWRYDHSAFTNLYLPVLLLITFLTGVFFILLGVLMKIIQAARKILANRRNGES